MQSTVYVAKSTPYHSLSNLYNKCVHLVQFLFFFHLNLSRYCTPNQKLVCFVLLSQIINTFFENDICILQ